MKKSGSILLYALIALLMFSTASAEQSNKTEITFREFPWYAPFSEVHALMKTLSLTSEDLVKECGVDELYTSIPIAEYTADKLLLSFMYPLGDDGRVIHDNSLSELYIANYYFCSFVDKQATFDDFKAKMTTLYGECINKEDRSSIYLEEWSDASGNIARLIMDKNINDIRLLYIAGDFGARLDALLAEIKEEANEAENAWREKNASNIDGL